MKLSQDLKIGSSVFFHFFNKYLLNPHFVLGIVVDIGEQNQVNVPSELAFLWGKTDKQINKYINCQMFIYALAKLKKDIGDQGY